MNKNKWFLNGGRGSGRTYRLLCETYENKIADLQHKLDTLQGYLDHDIEYDMDKTIQELRKENAELKEALKNDKVCKCSHYLNFKDLEKQLTKAKEILSKLLEEEKDNMYWEMNGSDKGSYYEVRKQAEQFLKNDGCPDVMCEDCTKDCEIEKLGLVEK